MTNYAPSPEFGWIDFSDTDRQKVMKVIELLQPDGTVDELGVGIIRNALSETMFPGITTIMTRAKYFFIVPRILQDFISKPPRGKTAKKYLHEEENELMYFLAKQNNYEDNTGVIGINISKENRNRAKHRWKELMRKPSSIYWNGLRTHQIYQGDLSLENFLDTLDKQTGSERMLGYQTVEGETSDDREAEAAISFKFSLPDYDKNWKERLRIELTEDEADFLKNKIIDSHPATLIAEVLSNKRATRDFLVAKNFPEMCSMPFHKQISPDTRAIVQTARDFWKIMFGAHIRYNIMLHERHGAKAFRKTMIDEWKRWVAQIIKFDWSTFDRDLMWETTHSKGRIKPFTKQFINHWMDRLQRKDYHTEELDQLVELQEKRNKSNRSKLRPQNDERYNKWVGIDRMNFRFGNAKTIVNDIVTPT